MEYRSVGASGLKVTPICLGTMMFGARTDEQEADRIVRRARDAGVNFIDTADYYAEGRGEAMVGDLIASDRDHWVVATKVGFRTGPGANEDGTSAVHVRASVEQSLRRLHTDRIDLYYVHRDDPTTQLGETLRVVGDLIAAGKVLYWGLSNVRGWRVAEAIGLARELAMPAPDRRPAVLQRDEPAAGGGAAPGLCPLRRRCHPLQPARPRGAHGQVPTGTGAAARFAGGAEGRPDARDGVAARVARARRANPGAR